MRTIHGSMMDAAGARPNDLARALGHLLEASLPSMEQPRRAPLPWLPAARAMSALLLAQHVASSQSAQAADVGTALPYLGADGSAAPQALAFGAAVLQQCASLQAQWLEGLAELGREMGEVRAANTLSKYVDHEMDLIQQSVALVADQLTATARLMENIQVNAAWLLSQRRQARVLTAEALPAA